MRISGFSSAFMEACVEALFVDVSLENCCCFLNYNFGCSSVIRAQIRGSGNHLRDIDR